MYGHIRRNEKGHTAGKKNKMSMTWMRRKGAAEECMDELNI